MHEKDWKEIYRRVRSKPIFMHNGRPSSALFKDSQGVSVNIDGGRTQEEIIMDEERLHRLYNQELTQEEIERNEGELCAIISLRKEQCESANVCVIMDPIEGENIYHALIQRSETEITLTRGQAKMLAREALVIKEYR